MPDESKRPGAVITAAVLLFVYAALCMPCGCGGMAVSFHPGFGHGPQPLPGQQEELLVISGLYLLASFVMIWTGIGILRLMPTARWTAYGVTAGHMFLVVVHGIFVLTYVAPERHPIGMHSLKDEGFWGAMVCPTIVPLMLALSIIALLSLKGARAAFVIPPSVSLQRDDFRFGMEEDNDENGQS